MKISFDLDQTLIPANNEFETEKQNLLQKILGLEKIRKGTKNLFRKLQSDGHSISIYTTSYRQIHTIRFNFYTYGLKLDRVVNETENRKKLESKNIQASKHPTTFGFDVHIDDLEGVKLEGERYSFKAIILKIDEPDWTNKILEGIYK